MGIFEHNLYKDPITGRNNFFSFIQSDFDKIFNDSGTILIVDIAYFFNYNKIYGRAKGDLCLKYLSDSIYNVLSEDSDAAVFRTHGDEFTIILPNKSFIETENICDMIKNEYEHALGMASLNGVELHTLVLQYDSKISSMEQFYELLVKKSLNQAGGMDDKYCGERLLKHMISGIIGRVRDTLSYYNDAYNFALVDDISGLGNHRAGKMFLDSVLKECKEKNTEFGVLFIDGDNLRRYNDISYEAGNEMIKALGRIITDSVRNEDKVYRWLSGDEFLVILKDANEINSLKSANRIRKEVEKQTRDMLYPTTVSVGLACFPSDSDSLEDIINKAEKANAIAKNSGKNKVIRWSSDM